MNTDPTDTRSPHLDLEDLIAEASGQPITDRAREHLATCAHCQLEKNRWNLVADGVRGLAASTPEMPQPARPRDARRYRLTRPVRNTLLGVSSAAAALIVLAGISSAAGIVHVHFGGGGGQTSLTAVTTVAGCPVIEQTSGTLERVNGDSVVIKAANGQLVTVTAAAATRVSASGPLLSHITDGAAVTVAGTGSGGAIAADLVLVGIKTSINVPGATAVEGTVADASAAGFTVVTSSGTRIPVTTSGSTDIVVVGNASLGMLQVGSTTMAIGRAGPHGTLSALGIVQPPDWPAGATAHVGAHVSDCSPASINREILALAGS